MPLFIERNDITKIKVDAICFSAFPTPKVGSGVDKAIYKAAGKYKLISERKRFGDLKIGESISTAAYDLPARNLIHTVIPEYIDGKQGEYDILHECYVGALIRAKELKCESIAFALLGAGAAGFPKFEAFHIAMSAIRKFLIENDMTVTIVVYDKISFDMSTKISTAVDEYIDENYITEHDSHTELKFSMFNDETVKSENKSSGSFDSSMFSGEIDYNNLTKELGNSFNATLFDYIDKSGMTDVEVYKAANIDKKLFSKIRSTPDYKPKKGNCLAFAIALRLDLEDTEKLLNSAEFTLSRSNKRDLAVAWHIQNKIYDINTINIQLSIKELPLLGSTGRD
ncbi:MAG: macro domain-containing protein [Parabacteroides sp.]|nr:macro domain-containing protein [Parabacteroides sp.]